jgi:hypothetical protein
MDPKRASVEQVRQDEAGGTAQEDARERCPTYHVDVDKNAGCSGRCNQQKDHTTKPYDDTCRTSW